MGLQTAHLKHFSQVWRRCADQTFQPTLGLCPYLLLQGSVERRGGHRRLMLTGSEKGGLIFGVVAAVIIVAGLIIGAFKTDQSPL